MQIVNNTVLYSQASVLSPWIDMARYTAWSLNVTGLEVGGSLTLFGSNSPIKAADGVADPNAVQLGSPITATAGTALVQGTPLGVMHWMQIQKTSSDITSAVGAPATVTSNGTVAATATFTVTAASNTIAGVLALTVDGTVNYSTTFAANTTLAQAVSQLTADASFLAAGLTAAVSGATIVITKTAIVTGNTVVAAAATALTQTTTLATPTTVYLFAQLD